VKRSFEHRVSCRRRLVFEASELKIELKKATSSKSEHPSSPHRSSWRNLPSQAFVQRLKAFWNRSGSKACVLRFSHPSRPSRTPQKLQNFFTDWVHPTVVTVVTTGRHHIPSGRRVSCECAKRLRPNSTVKHVFFGNTSI